MGIAWVCDKPACNSLVTVFLVGVGCHAFHPRKGVFI